MKTIIFTVTNDLSYDQRMQRICTTLSANGYRVVLAGRKLHSTQTPEQRIFEQVRLQCWFNKGFIFYAEYNARLFCWLLFQRADIICAVDLDTILPCYVVSGLKHAKRVYDAHELFTEQKEVISRSFVHKFWLVVEKVFVPKFKQGYTVSQSIAEEFYRRYKVHYEVIRNLPVRNFQVVKSEPSEKFILYQGAVNEARGLENLIAAMQYVDVKLYIYGTGNLSDRIAELIKEKALEKKVFLKGNLPPAQLKKITTTAYIGVNLVEPKGLNQLYSLANKFFDYIQAGLPQLTMNFTEYRRINQQFETAVLIDTVEKDLIAGKLNLLLNDTVLYKRLQANCLKAAEVYNWQQEEQKLVNFYNML